MLDDRVVTVLKDVDHVFCLDAISNAIGGNPHSEAHRSYGHHGRVVPRSAGSRCCHENVTQSAENRGKNAANNNKGRRRQVAGLCPNLLIPFD
jgi:hypothetical protein